MVFNSKDFKHRLKLSFILMVVIFLCCFFLHSFALADSPQNVLIINSYHRGVIWTEEQTTGIIESLNNMNIKHTAYIEYLDWKNYPTKENIDYLYQHLLYKYRGAAIDIVIVTDDKALEFALQYREQIFPSTPIVFSGVNDIGYYRYFENFVDVTGVMEIVEPEETVKLVLQLNPDMKNFYVIFDNTESGISTGILALHRIKSMGKNINAIPLTNMSYGAILEAVEKVPENSCILITSFFMDSEGLTMETEDFSLMVSNNSRVPIFSLYDFDIGYGVVGGNMLSGRLQGNEAGLIAARILNGENPSEIHISRAKTTRNLFDYNQIKRFNIPMNLLPPDSEIINKPFSFFETYKTLVMITMLFIAMLIIFIIILLTYIIKIRRIRSELSHVNEELSQLFEELTASEEELRSQYEELNGYKETLEESEERYRLFVQSTNDAIVEWNPKTNEVLFSNKWHDIDGNSFEVGKTIESLYNLIHPHDIHTAQKDLLKRQQQNLPYFTNRYRLKTKDGNYRWFLIKGSFVLDSDGKPNKIVKAYTDIDDLTKFQERLEYHAYHDDLTQLPNRLALTETLAKHIEKNNNKEVAIIFIDTDDFKIINDSMGHSFGDRFIMKLAEKVNELVLNDGGIVFRIGGDEFVVLFFGFNRDSVIPVANRIIEGFKMPIILEGNHIYTSVSLGISLYPDHGKTVNELIKYADMAMYQAKEHNKGNLALFNTNMIESFNDRLEMENRLRRAIEDNEFVLHYQPQIEMKTRKIWGFEALIRWNSNELGFVSPLKFIKVAEDSRLIIPIGKFVLEESCRFIKRLHNLGYNDYMISINISLIQIQQDNFCQMIIETLKDNNIPYHCVELEITESVLMESMNIIQDKLEKLRNLGVKTALDDFGKGYSSLNYLKKLPIDTLKIDRDFIQDITQDNKGIDITSTIVDLGHKLGLEIVAEGVELQEQWEYILKHNCDRVQGYLVCRPIPEHEIMEFIKKN